MNKNFFLSLVLAAIVAINIVPNFVAAQNVPGMDFDFTPGNTSANNVASQGPCKSTDKLGTCIVNIYRWALGAAVLLALLMIIFAGYKYIISQGNAQDVASAKEMFTGAIIGLIILFAAVVILSTINPDLVSFSNNLAPLSNSGNSPRPQ